MKKISSLCTHTAFIIHTHVGAYNIKLFTEGFLDIAFQNENIALFVKKIGHFVHFFAELNKNSYNFFFISTKNKALCK